MQELSDSESCLGIGTSGIMSETATDQPGVRDSGTLKLCTIMGISSRTAPTAHLCNFYKRT